MHTPELDPTYVRKNARPGEEWEHALFRLEREVVKRFCKLPVCEVCSAGERDLASAAATHASGECTVNLTAWPAAALSQRVFEAVTEQSALHTRAQAALARSRIQLRLHNITHETHPINALRAACAVEGYIQACAELGLFEPQELADFQRLTHEAHQKAEADFVRQFHERDPNALPWRSARVAT